MTIEQHLDTFIKKLRNLRKEKSIKDYCDSEAAMIRSFATAPNQIKATIDRYREAVSDYFGENHTALNYIILTPAERAATGQDTQAEAMQQQGIRDIDTLIQTAVGLLSARGYAETTIGLCLLTGRQPSQLLKTARFIYEDETHVRFQYKDRSSYSTVIPVLCESRATIDALNRLQAKKDFTGVSDERLNAMVGKELQQATKAHFGVWVQGITTKDLQAMYAAIASHRFAYSGIQADGGSGIGEEGEDLRALQRFYIIE